MANVDECVRLCEAALCSKLKENAEGIYKLPNTKKVLIFRNKGLSEIINILENCKETIQISLLNEFYQGELSNKKISFKDLILKKSSDNNKKGADLFHILPNGNIVDIEVKFGQKTDKAIGMKVFNEIFGNNIFSDILSSTQRVKWKKEFLINRDEVKQINKLHNILNKGIEKFNNFNQNKNFTLSKKEQKFMEDLIINNSGDIHNKVNHYLRFIIKDNDFENIKKLPTGVGEWNILKVKKIEKDIKRMNVFVINRTTNLQIKYTLN